MTRKGLAGLLLSVVLVMVGWVLTYSSGMPEALVFVLLLGMLGIPVSLVVMAVGLLRRPQQN